MGSILVAMLKDEAGLSWSWFVLMSTRVIINQSQMSWARQKCHYSLKASHTETESHLIRTITTSCTKGLLLQVQSLNHKWGIHYEFDLRCCFMKLLLWSYLYSLSRKFLHTTWVFECLSSTNCGKGKGIFSIDPVDHRFLSNT